VKSKLEPTVSALLISVEDGLIYHTHGWETVWAKIEIKKRIHGTSHTRCKVFCYLTFGSIVNYKHGLSSENARQLTHNLDGRLFSSQCRHIPKAPRVSGPSRNQKRFNLTLITCCELSVTQCVIFCNNLIIIEFNPLFVATCWFIGACTRSELEPITKYDKIFWVLELCSSVRLPRLAFRARHVAALPVVSSA